MRDRDAGIAVSLRRMTIGVPHAQTLPDGLPQSLTWSWCRWRTTAPGIEFVDMAPGLLIERRVEFENLPRCDTEIAAQRVEVAGVRRWGSTR